MTKNELSKALRENLPKDVASQAAADRIVNYILDTIKTTVASKEDVTLIGFGTFSAESHTARVGHNPQTGEKMTIPASTKPKFKAGKTFKDVVNKAS